MLKEDIERIECYQKQLREQLQRIPDPLITLDGDEDGHVISGNEAAFIRLAVNSLDVARGRNVAFDPAITTHGVPTTLLGMTYDITPTVPMTREQPWWGKIVAVAILGAFGIVIATGVAVDITWIEHRVEIAFRR